jgi:high-affinity iron transporter
MLGALIIVFREIIEAGLIVGIVLAVTQGVRGSRLVIAAGVAAGVVGACLVAAFAGVLANALAGVGQEIFNASILLVAVVMLIGHNVWMAKHGRELAAGVKKVGEAVRTGRRPVVALGVVCAVAVVREGSEIALFMYGLAASAGSTMADLLTGSALGLAAGVGVTVVTYFGLVTIPPRRLFAVTTLLISFLAAGLAAQAVLFLQQAGVVTVLDQTAWDSSAILSDTSLFGRVLHTLIGYSDQPSVLQVVVYAATLAIIVVLTGRRTRTARSWTCWRRRSPRARARIPASTTGS